MSGIIEIERPGSFITERDNLQAGKFYEESEGTVVFVSRGPIGFDNPVNIENGLANYSSSSRFRLLRPTHLKFSLVD